MKYAKPEICVENDVLAAIQGREKGDGHTDGMAPHLPEISSGAYEADE